MEQVESVALWAGLIASIVGVVLAIVSILFTNAVERRSSELNTQIVQTLQKIETAVDRSTDDTTNLIKVAWERLLPSSDVSSGPPLGRDPDFAKQIAAGVAAELRSELLPLSDGDEPKSAEEPSVKRSADGSSDNEPIQVDEMLERIQRTLETHLRFSPSSESSLQSTNAIYNTIKGLPALAQVLLRIIAENGHLTRRQFTVLSDGRFGDLYQELRRQDLLVPLVAGGASKKAPPVYWLPAGLSDQIRAVLSLMPTSERRESAADAIRAEMRSVGYLPPTEDPASSKSENRPQV
ncbi:hypothetical protein [Rhodococcoides fascians]|uniref:hypothetical protein n=1 Tax=Rhodococcoides fascians TaxID=1828 RepID=UPI0012D2C08B|nr:hypothetical protein [Rhodococcus fascians]